MYTRKSLVAAALALSFGAGAALAENSGLGKPLSEQDVKQWDIAILPDGTNLPPGSGTPAHGAEIYAQKCAAWPRRSGQRRRCALLSGAGRRCAAHRRHRHGQDHQELLCLCHDDLRLRVRRGMPYNMPRSLTDDETYALTAYILSINKLIGDNDVMDANTLPKVKMPNRDNFIMPYPDRI